MIRDWIRIAARKCQLELEVLNETTYFFLGEESPLLSMSKGELPLCRDESVSFVSE